jgi:hypothetical protein
MQAGLNIIVRNPVILMKKHALAKSHALTKKACLIKSHSNGVLFV